MALVPYTAYLYFPGGQPAANWTVGVFPRASNVPALLYSDSAGITPMANPTVTDADGMVSFYAAPGDYMARVGMEYQPVGIDPGHTDPVWPGLHIHEQTIPASTWTIAHHFGIEPHVQIVVAGGDTEAEITHPDPETTVVLFGAPTTGVAHLRR